MNLLEKFPFCVYFYFAFFRCIFVWVRRHERSPDLSIWVSETCRENMNISVLNIWTLNEISFSWGTTSRNRSENLNTKQNIDRNWRRNFTIQRRRSGSRWLEAQNLLKPSRCQRKLSILKYRSVCGSSCSKYVVKCPLLKFFSAKSWCQA